MKRRTFEVEEPGPLSAALARGLQATAKQALDLVTRGAVYIDGKRARGEQQLRPGARVMVVLEGGQAASAVTVAPAALVVLFEDDDVLAVNKAAGVVAQPTAGRVGDSLLDLATRHLGYAAGLVHRLDRETSGVTVFGKHAKATSRLAAAFREGRAKKEYLAVTAPGLPASGSIDLPLSKDPSRPGRFRASAKANGVPALTHYERLHDGPEVSVVALFPQTGRTHQLRAHLAALGHPILGDPLYGGKEGGRCLLHARRLEIEGWSVEAPVPGDLAAWLPSTVLEQLERSPKR